MATTSDNCFNIAGRKIGGNEPTYFIADIAANHDGDLQRALDLIHLAAEAGADAAKFQHFKAETIVSDFGFKALGGKQSHQSQWKESVFEVYQKASVDLGWTPYLKEACDTAGITFFTSPYAPELVDAVDPYVAAYKIGSGDITWVELIEYIAGKNKPYILATGASSMDDVQRAVEAALQVNPQLALLQCNTNYTASLENFKFIQLNVLRVYREMYPEIVLGLSDHTLGHTTVLGAVSLGARIIEKHFTDDPGRIGPDHAFSMDPITWREMVARTRELENSLGTGIKKVEDNEVETSVLQRRAIRLSADSPKGSTLTRSSLTVLRPCPENALPPYELTKIIGKQLRRSMKAGDSLGWNDIE
ncbi:MAG: N-acetylneuraminate synthase family protein [Proteobacteria bacterium]|nr:N-acetylneuraminate synthase family protein [Pseudomonadota bacterium]